MGHKMGIAIAAFAFAAAGASSASAQTSQQAQQAQQAQLSPLTQQSTLDSERLPRGTIKAPSKAFEIQVNTGYAQGFGPRIPGRGNLPATSLDRPGMGAGLGLAYRATPHASVGVVGTYSMQDSAKGAQLRNATAGLDATYHVSPFRRFDPYVSIGAGYRMLWDNPANGRDTFAHGFQLGRAAVGVDVRVNKDIAIAPTIGGDLDMFLWQTGAGQTNATIKNPKVNGYLFAGVSGRFDLGGNRQGPPTTYMGRR